MTNHAFLKSVGAAASVLLAASTAHAVDFDGYLRAGPGATSKGAARACYNLNGAGVSGAGTHYRLGNECDFYGEFGLAQTGTVEGVTYKAKVMFNEYNPGTDIGTSSASLNQMYVEGKGFDIAPNTNFWVGKRFYGRADVHILDYKFVQLDGVGAGADGIGVGSGKLALAYFRTDNGNLGSSTTPGTRLNADLSELAVNAGGKLRLTGTYTKGDFSASPSGPGTSGYALSVQHDQENFLGLGGGNTLWVQYAQGSAGMNQNFGNLTAVSGTKSFRVVESLTWQKGALGGQGVALWETNKDGTTGLKTDLISVGGRASYAVGKNFKLVAEAGYSEKKPEGAPTQKLAKFTFAPTLSTGPGFWSRPELRLYVTTAKWNSAANAGAGPTGLTGLSNGKTRGTSVGAQAEIWF
jgi:maltoporin